MNELITAFQQTLEDKHFSRAEKKAVMAFIRELSPDKRQRDFLRSKIFDLAKENIDDFSKEAIINWLEVANKTLLDRNEPTAISNVYFSPGEECRSAICYALAKATMAVDVCVFTISDDQISKKLFDCQHRGIKVRIISDNEKMYDKGSDIRSLAKAGIPIRIDFTEHHMHHKFAIIDNKYLITGSYNWTRSAADYNHENIIVTDDMNILKEYSSEFRRLWDVMKPVNIH